MAAGYSVTINAVDRATGVINRVNTGLESIGRRAAAVRAPFERFSSAVDRLAQNTGVDRLATGFQNVGRRAVGAAESLGRFAPALATITSAASIAGLARLVETWTGFGSKLGFDAQRIGIASRNLHGLQSAARLAGSSAEALTSGMTTLGDNLTDAVGGRSPETIQMLSTLGIAFQDASGHARTAEAVLPQLADRIAAIKNPALQARAATALFGGAGEALLPFLRRGAAGIADYNAQALRYGLLNEDGVRAANAMREAQTRLGLAVEGVGYSVAERVAPVLVPMLDRLSEWVAAHREQIAGFFKDVADRLGRWVDAGGLQDLLTRLGNMASAMGRMVTGIQDFGKAARGVFDATIGKVSDLIGWLDRVTNFGPPEWMKRWLGIDTSVGELKAVPDPNAGLLNGRQLESFDPNIRRLLAAPVGEHEPDDRPGHVARSVPLPAGEQATRARAAFDYYVRQGDTPEVAAGRVANLVTESGMNERAVGDGGAAYGLGQHHEDRRRAFRAMFGHDMREASFEEQLAFNRSDPDIGAQRANQIIARPGTTAGQAAAQISRLNERPADEAGEMQRRAALAERLLRQYTAVPVPAPAAAPIAAAPAPIATAPNASGSNGTTTVRLEHVNPPDGLRTSVQTTGDVQYGGMRIERQQIGSLP